MQPVGAVRWVVAGGCLLCGYPAYNSKAGGSGYLRRCAAQRNQRGRFQVWTTGPTGREVVCYCRAYLLLAQSQQDLVRDRVENSLQLAGIGGEICFAGDLIRIVRRPRRIVGNVL
jgi:hypothetical protein